MFTLIVSFFNWGLGLIFGAIFARKVGENAQQLGRKLNYPLIVASGYTGLMVWHGGISGSAPLKVAEAGHFLDLIGKDIPAIDFGQTIFSTMNLSIFAFLLAVIPIFLYFLGSISSESLPDLKISKSKEKVNPGNLLGAEKLDHSTFFGTIIGLSLLIFALYKAIITSSFKVIDPNYLNFILLGLGILLSGNINQFIQNVKNAMGSASGILIQFPLYFGIMGIMKYSGLVEIFSGFLINISNDTTFPIFTFFSAGLVNIFVPSGGGQWAVQGPIIIEAAQNLNVPLGKAIMALAYGDQVTNMLQPFWALPLLGITGLKVKDIIPFCLLLMIMGIAIFLAGLLLF
jgi:short-chain fatty acids transporter